MRDLREVDSLELFSLAPISSKSPEDGFHGWRVLGKTAISSSTEREEIVHALDNAIREHGQDSNIMCFNPRHGIRIRAVDRRLDLVICFECEKFYSYREGAEDREAVVHLKRSAQPVLDEVLRRADVPLPRQRGD
jgi:hypothetical protein